MAAFSKTALAVFATLVLTSAALAAPNGTPDPAADCASAALLQFNLDYAQCAALPFQVRDPCLAQAHMKYGSALAACAGKASSVRTGVTPSLKLNTDSGFLRRLRY